MGEQTDNHIYLYIERSVDDAYEKKINSEGMRRKTIQFLYFFSLGNHDRRRVQLLGRFKLQ